MGAVVSTDLDALAERTVALCKQHGWGLDWKNRGVILHLEASELIEAIRGKGKSTIEAEAGDVLFVLLSILGHHNIAFEEVVATIEAKMGRIEGLDAYDNYGTRENPR